MKNLLKKIIIAVSIIATVALIALAIEIFLPLLLVCMAITVIVDSSDNISFKYTNVDTTNDHIEPEWYEEVVEPKPDNVSTHYWYLGTIKNDRYPGGTIDGLVN